MRLWRYRLVCPHCNHPASRADVINAQIDKHGFTRGVEHAFNCTSCGRSVVPHYRARWLRATIYLSALFACLGGIFVYPRFLVGWILAIFVATAFTIWSLPYVTALKPANQREG